MILFRMHITAYFKYVNILSRTTGRIIEGMNLSEEEVYMIRLAVSEAVTNIVEHGYKVESNFKIEYEIQLEGEQLQFVFRDYTETNSDEKFESRDLDDFREGGLGIFLINNIMDEVIYENLENGTRLIMRKNIGVL